MFGEGLKAEEVFEGLTCHPRGFLGRPHLRYSSLCQSYPLAWYWGWGAGGGLVLGRWLRGWRMGSRAETGAYSCWWWAILWLLVSSTIIEITVETAI